MPLDDSTQFLLPWLTLVRMPPVDESLISADKLRFLRSLYGDRSPLHRGNWGMILDQWQRLVGFLEQWGQHPECRSQASWVQDSTHWQNYLNHLQASNWISDALLPKFKCEAKKALEHLAFVCDHAMRLPAGPEKQEQMENCLTVFAYLLDDRGSLDACAPGVLERLQEAENMLREGLKTRLLREVCGQIGHETALALVLYHMTEYSQGMEVHYGVAVWNLLSQQFGLPLSNDPYANPGPWARFFPNLLSRLLAPGQVIDLLLDRLQWVALFKNNHYKELHKGLEAFFGEEQSQVIYQGLMDPETCLPNFELSDEEVYDHFKFALFDQLYQERWWLADDKIFDWNGCEVHIVHKQSRPFVWIIQNEQRRSLRAIFNDREISQEDKRNLLLLTYPLDGDKSFLAWFLEDCPKEGFEFYLPIWRGGRNPDIYRPNMLPDFERIEKLIRNEFPLENIKVGDKLIDFAFKNRQADLIAVLIEKDADQFNITHLILAIERGYLNVVRAAIASPLHFHMFHNYYRVQESVIRLERTEILKVMLLNGVVPSPNMIINLGKTKLLRIVLPFLPETEKLNLFNRAINCNFSEVIIELAKSKWVMGVGEFLTILKKIVQYQDGQVANSYLSALEEIIENNSQLVNVMVEALHNREDLKKCIPNSFHKSRVNEAICLFHWLVGYENLAHVILSVMTKIEFNVNDHLDALQNIVLFSVRKGYHESVVLRLIDFGFPILGNDKHNDLIYIAQTFSFPVIGKILDKYPHFFSKIDLGHILHRCAASLSYDQSEIRDRSALNLIICLIDNGAPSTMPYQWARVFKKIIHYRHRECFLNIVSYMQISYEDIRHYIPDILSLDWADVVNSMIKKQQLSLHQLRLLGIVDWGLRGRHHETIQQLVLIGSKEQFAGKNLFSPQKVCDFLAEYLTTRRKGESLFNRDLSRKMTIIRSELSNFGEHQSVEQLMIRIVEASQHVALEWSSEFLSRLIFVCDQYRNSFSYEIKVNKDGHVSMCLQVKGAELTAVEEQMSLPSLSL